MGTEPDWIRNALSLPRFAPYLARTGGDLAKAIELYWWNVDISGAFSTSLHGFEMALRNSIHEQMTKAF